MCDKADCAMVAAFYNLWPLLYCNYTRLFWGGGHRRISHLSAGATHRCGPRTPKAIPVSPGQAPGF